MEGWVRAGVERFTVPGRAWETAPTESCTPSPVLPPRGGDSQVQAAARTRRETGRPAVEQGRVRMGLAKEFGQLSAKEPEKEKIVAKGGVALSA